MTLKTAALLALIGMILLTVLMAADFVNIVLAFLRDVVPAMALLRSLIYVLASLTVTVFFWVSRSRSLELASARSPGLGTLPGTSLAEAVSTTLTPGEPKPATSLASPHFRNGSLCAARRSNRFSSTSETTCGTGSRTPSGWLRIPKLFSGGR